MAMEQNQLRKIPSVNIILETLKTDFPQIPHTYLKRITMREIEKVHHNPKSYNLDAFNKSEFETVFIKRIEKTVEKLKNGSLGKVINATGVVLHTGLGRAPMAEGIMDSLKEVSRYTNLEIDISSGKRGQRNDHLSFLLQILSGAEDGFAVNNNAAAVMLMLNSTAKRKEVIISRGEMIEIGGSFRLPEVMKISGVKLKEIGATNKTHLKDYEEAIGKKTGAILICHTSNYEVKGFTAKPAIDKIVKLAAEHKIPVIYDMGSGALVEEHRFGHKEEPLVSELVEADVDLISFSGDKLVGGPQAGFIVGKKEWVKKCAKNHFLRALRLDKTIIKLLQVTLLNYLQGGESMKEIDSLTAILEAQQNLKKRSLDFINSLPKSITMNLSVIESDGKVGSGAFPLLQLPSVAIKIDTGKEYNANHLARKFRENNVPVFGRIENDKLLFDLRTVSQNEIPILREAMTLILGNQAV
jgi:L-seryl-tRNA(Ser) seleniumtransferase